MWISGVCRFIFASICLVWKDDSCHNDTVRCECKISMGTRETPTKQEEQWKRLEVFNTIKTNRALLLWIYWLSFNLRQILWHSWWNGNKTTSHSLFIFTRTKKFEQSNKNIVFKTKPNIFPSKYRENEREKNKRKHWQWYIFDILIFTWVERNREFFSVLNRSSCFHYWALTAVIIIYIHELKWIDVL